MSIRNQLNRSLTQFLKHNQSGSYSTQFDRINMLTQFADDLVSLGFGLSDIRGLKQKHILAVVKFWQEKGLSNSTLKNRSLLYVIFVENSVSQTSFLATMN